MKDNHSYLTILALTLLFVVAAHANEPFMLKDINPGAGYSNSSFLTNVNGTLFFRANDGTYGAELWKSDGTPAGTVMVKDIYPAESSDPTNLTNVNGTLFFMANDGTNGYELWKSDGTSAGTVMVKDIYPGVLGSYLFYLTNVNGTLFFQANDGTNGYELWKSDGTDAGTVMVKDIAPGVWESSPGFLTNVNGILFFAATDGTNGFELWKSNGTEAGTVMVKDIYPVAGNSYPNYLTNVNGILFFAATDGTNGAELWKSNGTDAGTVMVKDIYPGAESSDLYEMTNVNGTLFFTANDGISGVELWMYILPSSDECEDSSEIFSGQTYYSSNEGLTGTDLTSCAYNDFADVWYYYQPQVTGQYTINAGSSEFDTTLAVFNACGGNELACNDDFLSTDSQLVLDMVKGKRYYIRLAGFDGQTGNYELAISAGDCSELALSDLNGDCVVNMLDFSIMASEWLKCNKIPPTLCGQ